MSGGAMHAEAPCAPAPVVPGAFAATEDGGWRFDGALTLDTAGAVLEQSATLALPVNGRVDVAGITVADSAALAVLLAVKRRASAEHHKLHVVNMPASLATLGRVYGVEDLIEA